MNNDTTIEFQNPAFRDEMTDLIRAQKELDTHTLWNYKDERAGHPYSMELQKLNGMPVNQLSEMYS